MKRMQAEARVESTTQVAVADIMTAMITSQVIGRGAIRTDNIGNPAERKRHSQSTSNQPQTSSRLLPHSTSHRMQRRRRQQR